MDPRGPVLWSGGGRGSKKEGDGMDSIDISILMNRPGKGGNQNSHGTLDLGNNQCINHV